MPMFLPVMYCQRLHAWALKWGSLFFLGFAMLNYSWCFVWFNPAQSNPFWNHPRVSQYLIRSVSGHSSDLSTLVPEVFLIFTVLVGAAREPRSGEHESRSGEKEKPLVTLDLNLTFMQTPGSRSDPRARIGWYFYKHANKYGWSVWLAIPRGRWGYLLLHLPEKKYACKVLQFLVYINVQDS